MELKRSLLKITLLDFLYGEWGVVSFTFLTVMGLSPPWRHCEPRSCLARIGASLFSALYAASIPQKELHYFYLFIP